MKIGIKSAQLLEFNYVKGLYLCSLGLGNWVITFFLIEKVFGGAALRGQLQQRCPRSKYNSCLSHDRHVLLVSGMQARYLRLMARLFIDIQLRIPLGFSNSATPVITQATGYLTCSNSWPNDQPRTNTTLVPPRCRTFTRNVIVHVKPPPHQQ